MADDTPQKGESYAEDPAKFYEAERARCRKFLERFRPESLPGQPREALKYMMRIQEVRRDSRAENRVINIELNDVKLMAHDLGGDFLKNIEGNTLRYIELFSSVVDDILRSAVEAIEITPEADAAEILRQHREAQIRESQRTSGGEELTADQIAGMFPPQLTRRYELRVVPLVTERSLSLREVTSKHLGRLVQVTATVLRVTDVKPLLEVGCSLCDQCGYENYQPVKGKVFMPLAECQSKVCKENRSRGKVHMQMRNSKFVKYQELKIQELPEHVPVGNIPRSMTVVCRGEISREVKAGEVVDIGGIFLPTPFTGIAAMRQGSLAQDTFLSAQSITCMKRAESVKLDKETEALIEAMSQMDPYTLLSRSIAPEIFGLEDVKKALLLQLVGGESRLQGDGMKTRGDINICLMGDPGVAKSQLLKHITKIAPRCVYTTGKGSSGVGLTATVKRDPLTNEMVLEGGALVLADTGICCIDEFDKMEESDRTAIHEVMEQQTVSIAKAGIISTLNARTAILAAANPRYGRYNRLADRDPHVALHKNINLPAALLSRFDLMFLLLDETDRDTDTSLAEHITYVHKNDTHPPLDFLPSEPTFIRQYINVVRHVHPYISPSLREYICESYVDIRAKDKARSLEQAARSTTTPRQLLSILRLAEAHAKINIREVVEQSDIDEAIRLIQMSKASVVEAESTAARGARLDPISRMWDLIKDKLSAKPNSISFEDARNLAQRSGFLPEQFEDFVNQYEGLNIIQVNASRTRIDLAT